jgi:hypothetical protein
MSEWRRVAGAISLVTTSTELPCVHYYCPPTLRQRSVSRQCVRIGTSQPAIAAIQRHIIATSPPNNNPPRSNGYRRHCINPLSLSLSLSPAPRHGPPLLVVTHPSIIQHPASSQSQRLRIRSDYCYYRTYLAGGVGGEAWTCDGQRRIR